MHDITDLPAWERLFKKIVWKQLGDMEGKKILDFGSGEGITANHFTEKNDVTAIEPSKEMLSNAWKDYEYTQIVGDVNALSAFKNETFDMIICHNVLEYIDDKAAVIKALARVLKKDGIISIVKHAPPSEYVARYREKLGEDGYKLACAQNALPENFEQLSYPEFLSQRRLLMAQIVKKAYHELNK